MKESGVRKRAIAAPGVAALSLLGLVAAMVALLAGWWLPEPWSVIAALAAAAAASACVGAAVSMILGSPDGSAV